MWLALLAVLLRIFMFCFIANVAISRLGWVNGFAILFALVLLIPTSNSSDK